jgi:DNA-binding winged helix-turn-helix (wHTH) protein
MKSSFAGFTLDLDRRLLLRGEEPVHLAPKALELLALLIRSRPNAVSKQEIFRTLWPDTFVTDNVLATLVSDLRVATGDDARQPRIIRTVHRFGYAFAAEAADVTRAGRRESVGQPQWSLSWERGSIPLETGVNVLGRSGDGVVIVDSPTVSKQHARIVVDAGGATIEDLGSKNGTWIGSRPIRSTTRLHDGDEIRMGSVQMTVRRHAGAASTQTATVRPFTQE